MIRLTQGKKRWQHLTCGQQSDLASWFDRAEQGDQHHLVGNNGTVIQGDFSRPMKSHTTLTVTLFSWDFLNYGKCFGEAKSMQLPPGTSTNVINTWIKFNIEGWPKCFFIHHNIDWPYNTIVFIKNTCYMSHFVTFHTTSWTGQDWICCGLIEI